MTLLHERYFALQISPVPVTFPLVGSALQLPYSILRPTGDARTECAAEAGEVDKEFEECDVDNGDEDGEGYDERETEDVDVAGMS